MRTNTTRPASYKGIVLMLMTASMLATAALAQDTGHVIAYGQLRTRPLFYATRAPNAAATVFVGEPIEVLAFVRNDGRESVDVVDGRDWRDTVSVTVRAKEPTTANDLAVQSASPRGARAAGIPAQNAVSQLFSVRRSSGSSLAPGTYVVRIAIPAVALGRTARPRADSLTNEITFEVREARSMEERLDLLWRASARAGTNGQPAEQERLLQEMLELNPQSVAAYGDLGRMAAARGDCGQSNAHYQKAIGIAAVAGDTFWKAEETTREDMISGLETLIAKCR